MTKWAVYDTRGRWALWGIATANMYRELTDGEGDYVNDLIAIGGWGLATGALLVPELLPRIIGWGVTNTWRGLGWAGRAAWVPVSYAVTAVVVPVTTGYLIGATVGTLIAREVWGEEGAQTAMGFYSGGLLPGTEAPTLTDYQYIFRPTEPGGPMSLYDVGAAAVKTVKKKRVRRRGPIRQSPRPWYSPYYLM